MAYSGNIVEYLGCGLDANKPVTLSLTPGALGLFLASDTNELWLWVEGSWQSRGSGGGIADAPSDGNLYGRKDNVWEVVSSGTVGVDTPNNVSGTITLDFASKSRYVGSITLGANVTTLGFANLPGAGKYAEYELHIKQDATGSRTFAIPASHKALGGSDTAIASAANAVTVLTASTVDNGTTWRYAMQESA